MQSVEKDRPADRAGLKHEDIIVKVDDLPVKNNRDLIDYVSGKAPGSKVTLTFLRKGEEKAAVATLATRGEDAGRPAPDEADVKGQKEKVLGLELSDLSPELKREFRVDREAAKGVLITHVKPVSPAADAGLIDGDVVLEVNGVEVGSVADVQAQMKKAPQGKWVRFYVLRSIGGPQKFIAAVKPE